MVKNMGCVCVCVGGGGGGGGQEAGSIISKFVRSEDL